MSDQVTLRIYVCLSCIHLFTSRHFNCYSETFLSGTHFIESRRVKRIVKTWDNKCPMSHPLLSLSLFPSFLSLHSLLHHPLAFMSHRDCRKQKKKAKLHNKPFYASIISSSFLSSTSPIILTQYKSASLRVSCSCSFSSHEETNGKVSTPIQYTDIYHSHVLQSN